MIRLGAYKPPLSDWIVACKHRGWVEMASELGARLGAQVRATVGASVLPTIVVPAPMPWLRRWERGVDHARIIAEGAAGVLGAPVAQILSRSNGPTQVSKGTRRLRRRGGQGVRLSAGWSQHRIGLWGRMARGESGLRVLDRLLEVMTRRRWERDGLMGHCVLLVDDVRTTGATLRACAEVIRALRPARVEVAILAVTDGTQVSPCAVV